MRKLKALSVSFLKGMMILSEGRVGFISLGCPKNQVDAEMMIARLSQAGYEIVDSALGADAVIINTCGFIEDAKKEAIDNILDMAQVKKDGLLGAVIVTGCLAQRYAEEIRKEIPEADAVIGIGANADIVDIVDRVLDGETIELFPPKENMPLSGERILTTPAHWAYLKIADGCSNCCTYCAIPSIRGPFRSRPMDEIVAEARTLAERGVRELILIAQDTTRYGEDLYGVSRLPELLKELCFIEGLDWIRILYCYPDRITDKLLKVMRDNDKILKYIDLPLQHCNGKILSAMNRTGDYGSLTALLKKIRSYMPDCVLRTTLITGFPGETDEDFNELSEFVKEAQFDRLGCFAYSPEEGTKAALMDNIPERELAEHRGEVIMEQQYRYFVEKQKVFIGTIQQCIVDVYDTYTDCYCGRTRRDAPEIDSCVYFTSEKPLEPGDIADVKILEVSDCDLTGVVV